MVRKRQNESITKMSLIGQLSGNVCSGAKNILLTICIGTGIQKKGRSLTLAWTAQDFPGRPPPNRGGGGGTPGGRGGGGGGGLLPEVGLLSPIGLSSPIGLLSPISSAALEEKRQREH